MAFSSRIGASCECCRLDLPYDVTLYPSRMPILTRPKHTPPTAHSLPATVINLAYCPPELRVLFLNCVFFCWVVYLSLFLNAGEETA